MGENCYLGIDVGSTTAKVVLLDANNQVLYTDYKRHSTRINHTVVGILSDIKKKYGDISISTVVTGSAGLGISERSEIAFIQEVVASTLFVKKKYPDVRTLIDIGGEDSKMIFFHQSKSPDIRMNGSCAGGTGAFIDQMATLLDVSPAEVNTLAVSYKNIYPIASRCGVFGKTDVQNLLSRKINLEDIAASIFHAVAIQVMNTLARGFDVQEKVMFSGGPFSFLPMLREIFMKNLGLTPENILKPKHPELLPAYGAAIHAIDAGLAPTNLAKVVASIAEKKTNTKKAEHRLTPLFANNEEFVNWQAENITMKVPIRKIEGSLPINSFLGIDSGSTTTKITLTDESGKLLFKFYKNNNGQAVETVKYGLKELYEEISAIGADIRILRTAVTGYGEDLIRAAFNIDLGLVETIAHYSAAKHFNPEVSFILDIGGQDMKAIYVDNGIVNRIELNESCSSGCGSFIQTFGNTLNYSVGDFAKLACSAVSPVDLGTRCTVFMNSKVKQALRENASVADISAGLSISVIKNALYKVLKISDVDELGQNIVVQGGAFRNPSLHRALEQLTGETVFCTDIPELMGAYGAALGAYADYRNNNPVKTTFNLQQSLSNIDNYTTKASVCKGCENNCMITKFTFEGAKKYYSGNKCEKYFTSLGNTTDFGINFVEFKNNLVFDRKLVDSKKTKTDNPIRIGIPRIMNLYENYPFWNKLFLECGFEIVLSSPSTMSLYEKGLGTVMSDSICFPAKLAHGHIFDLAEKGVDRIFYPIVVFETQEFKNAANSFNCPIVTGYPDVIRSAVNPLKRFEVQFDSPTINFADEKLLKRACYKYLQSLGIGKQAFTKAFSAAIEARIEFKTELLRKGQDIINNALKNNRLLFILSGRPYHVDALINHKTPDILASLGVDVITEDIVSQLDNEELGELQIISQWAYPNRIYNAAHWVSRQPKNVQFVQYNSFGCGPDAITVDECVEILRQKSKNHTVIRVDDITSTGSVRLRLRSMVESLKLGRNNSDVKEKVRLNTPIFGEKDKKRIIIGPQFGDFYSPFLPAIYKLAGYTMINLPAPNKESVQYGLKYSNNEICYPATIIVGDVIKALKTKMYKPEDVAVTISQTGGQCRASTYLSLIKKGMVAAGYSDVPIVALSTENDKLNPQPGFQVEWKKIMKVVFAAVLFADSLSKLYHTTIVRETNKGDSLRLRDKYFKTALPIIEANDTNGVFDLLEELVSDFNAVPVNSGFYPKIGIVGEIYVKYNSFGHYNIIEWLIGKGVEVVIPPILDFFTQGFINTKVNTNANVTRREFSDYYVVFLEMLANRYVNRANKILSRFKSKLHFHKLKDAAKLAKPIINLVNQYGEGWLIPAEIASFAKEGVNSVISLQPFGCIANHVISKGIEKRVKDLYPDMNILFLDFDDGTTEVNILNRLHFMLTDVFENKKK